ncbi:MAG TPA: HutD family protein [Steroidobacteraceae bacterium]
MRESEYVTVPWKNGGGLTREILRVPSDAASFDWRLSLATIATPGPFSAFDGCERTLVLVRGAGVALDFGPYGQTTLRAPGQLVAFDGAWPTRCTLIDGPSTDLNLIVARARAEAHAVVLRVTAPRIIHTSGWEETLVCCISGSVRIETGTADATTLRGADVARCNPGDGVMTCGSQEHGPALLLVAAVRHRGG